MLYVDTMMGVLWILAMQSHDYNVSKAVMNEFSSITAEFPIE